MRRIKYTVVLVWTMVAVVIGSLAVSRVPTRGQSVPEQRGLDSLAVGDAQFNNCRTGVGVVNNPITDYAIDPLNLGWYVDWRWEQTPSPAGIEHYATIRVKQGTSGGVYLPTYTIRPPLTMSSGGLGPLVQANAGKVWLVGNEPDIATQDGTEPELYAEIYHSVYHFIKGIDPTARVAIGATVQPSPLRLQYLDRVLAAYRANYGTKLPVDVWNTHLYIAQEVRDADWGVYIPVGFDDVDVGMRFGQHDSVDVEILKAFIVDLRTWMKERGYQDVPLIITEWGGLMPLWFLDDGGVNVTEQDFHEFLRDSIAYMSTASDPNLGYPGDGYRLVQRAALWSLNADDVFAGSGLFRFGPSLFRSQNPYPITSTGIYYRDVIAPAYSPEVDLSPYRAWYERRPVAPSAGEPVSVTLKTLVGNAGNTTFGSPTQVEFVNVTNGANEALGSAQLLPFTGCGYMREVSVLWSDVSPGVYDVLVKVDAAGAVTEVKEDNNETTIKVVVGGDVVFMPTVSRQY